MINSHYIPQFVLRNFCNENKILYCDIDKRTVEARNTRSVFAEKGYYPEQTEIDLCKDIEYDFSVLYHNKLEKPGSSITFDEDELFILKKYLIVSSIRFQYEYTQFELDLINKFGDSYKPDLVNNLNKVLKANNIRELYSILEDVDNSQSIEKLLSGERLDDENVNMSLWAEVKDILHSYVVFIKASGSEKFIIPDMGKGIYEGPMSRRKLTGLIQNTFTNPNPVIMQIMLMLTPHDYTIYPLTKDIAILSMSVFFKLFTDSEIKTNVILPDDCPTVSAMLGFGSSNDIVPPKVRINRGKKEYRYSVNRLNSQDVSHFNCLMMAEAKHYLAFSDVNDISKSLEQIKEYTDRDFEFLSR